MEYLFKLKLLNGWLAGREIGLPAGDTRIGSGLGNDADLAIPLENGAATVLHATPDGVTLSPAIPTWIDGLPWTQDGPLPRGKVIDLAGQAFILDAPEETLLTVPVPDRRIEEKESARAQPIRPGSPSSRWAMSIGTGVAIAAVLAGGLAMWQPVSAPVPFNATAWVKQQLSDPALSHINVKHRHNHADGVIVLQGTCASSQKKDDMLARLRERGILYADETVCTDTLLQQVRKILELNGYQDFDVAAGGRPDAVNIRGNVRADEKWQETADQLRQLRGLQQWSVNNDSAQLFDKLLTLLDKRHLLEGMSITLTGHELLVTGLLANRNAPDMRTAIDMFNLASPRLKASFHNIPSSLPDADLLPSPIVSLGGNAKSPYIELANGMRLQTGSMLPSGYVIHSLSKSSVALRKDQKLISLPLNL